MAVATIPAPEQAHGFHAATLDASLVVDAINICVGEIALALRPDDPRRDALGSVQSGLDQLYSVERHDPIDRHRLDAALERIGHRGKPAFRARLAAAYDEVAR